MIWLALACAHAPQTPLPSQPEDWRVATWNVFWDAQGLDEALPLIREMDADLLLLQETNPAWEAGLRAGLEQHYPHQLYAHGEGLGAGLAVLSVHPFEPVAQHESPVPRGFQELRVEVEVPGLGRVVVSNLHLVSPHADVPILGLPVGFFTTKPQRRRELATYFPSDEPLPDLIAGDFNANERERALRELKRRGMESVLPERYPGQRTWHGPGDAPLQWRIDHLWLGPALEARDVRVFEEGPSDHWPVLAAIGAAR